EGADLCKTAALGSEGAPDDRLGLDVAALEHCPVERLLPGEVVEDGRLLDAHLLGDLVQARPMVAVRGKTPRGDRLDCLPRAAMRRLRPNGGDHPLARGTAARSAASVASGWYSSTSTSKTRRRAHGTTGPVPGSEGAGRRGGAGPRAAGTSASRRSSRSRAKRPGTE